MLHEDTFNGENSEVIVVICEINLPGEEVCREVIKTIPPVAGLLITSCTPFIGIDHYFYRFSAGLCNTS